MESITNRLDQVEERLSRIEDNVQDLVHSDNRKGKNTKITISKTSGTQLRNQKYEFVAWERGNQDTA
jgi:hypothetical protein